MKNIHVTRIGERLGLSNRAATLATTTTADQCVASASNFAVGIVVARLSGPQGLGAFAFAYTCWILLTTLHRSLITDPMMILGDMRREDAVDLRRRGFAAEIALGALSTLVFAATGTILLAAGQHTFGVGLLVLAPWILFLNLQDYWRQTGFMQGLPKKSLHNDLVFMVVQAVAFAGAFIFGLHTVFAAVSAWGLGAAIAALYGLRQFSVRPSLRGGWAFLRSRLPMSRWLAGERTASWGGSQLYLLLAGALLGPAALGGLKAAQAMVMGPAFVLINAGGHYGLPEASRQLAERGWAGLARVARFVTGAAVLATTATGLVVFVAAGPLLDRLYGPQFAAFATSARIFAIAFVIGAFGIGPTLILNVTVRVRPLFFVQIGRTVVSVIAVYLLSNLYGVNGAAMASLVAVSFNVVSTLILKSSARRSLEGKEPEFAEAFPPSESRVVAQGEPFPTSRASTPDCKTPEGGSYIGSDANLELPCASLVRSGIQRRDGRALQLQQAFGQPERPPLRPDRDAGSHLARMDNAASVRIAGKQFVPDEFSWHRFFEILGGEHDGSDSFPESAAVEHDCAEADERPEPTTEERQELD